MIVTKNFTVEIDGAKFTFKKPTMVSIWKSQEAAKDNFEATSSIFEGLIKVEGLFNESNPENGEVSDITLEQVKGLDIPADLVNLIIRAWSAELKKLSGDSVPTEVSAEKKE